MVRGPLSSETRRGLEPLPRILCAAPQADNISAIVKAAGIEVEPYWPGLFAKLAEKKSIEDFIVNVGAGAQSMCCARGAGWGRGEAPKVEGAGWEGARPAAVVQCAARGGAGGSSSSCGRRLAAPAYRIGASAAALDAREE